ncbi:MAG TPA: ceramide glucosyltransferase [Isosphaeraceae bacterium]|nr:ceramide glucosyltransferase [Isosphaeraceae bacterium]
MQSANVVLGIVAAIAVGLTLFSMVALFWVTRRPKKLADFAPPVTIYKPLKGIDDALEENLRSFFRLDYPVYQLIFGVCDQDDPAIEVVRKLLAEFPTQDAHLVAGAAPFGLNPKVENLAAMEPFRKHDTILISDSNVRVRPSYLRETACYLADPEVGIVTNLFAGVREQQSAAALENLQLNGFIAGGFAAAAVLRLTCVVGKSMLMPKRALEATGGFSGVRNILAEDQVIGIRVRKAGYSIRLSHHVIENVNETRSLRWFLNRHSRWYKIRKQLALGAFLIEPITNLTTVGLVWAVAVDSPVGLAGLGALAGLAIARDVIQSFRLRGSLPKLRFWPLSLVKDLFLLPIWVDALFDRRIFWRGHRFLIARYTKLRQAPISASVRRRMRRQRWLRLRNRS